MTNPWVLAPLPKPAPRVLRATKRNVLVTPQQRPIQLFHLSKRSAGLISVPSGSINTEAITPAGKTARLRGRA